jgi:hypothetical protein
LGVICSTSLFAVNQQKQASSEWDGTLLGPETTHVVLCLGQNEGQALVWTIPPGVAGFGGFVVVGVLVGV